MTTSRQKAVGSAAEREVAALLGGQRVYGYGPIDVIVTGYSALQVKKRAGDPSLQAIVKALDAMSTSLLRGYVVIHRAGQGKRGRRTITFDLDEYALWHGARDKPLGSDTLTSTTEGQVRVSAVRATGS
jgi:hypothetical protein